MTDTPKNEDSPWIEWPGGERPVASMEEKAAPKDEYLAAALALVAERLRDWSKEARTDDGNIMRRAAYTVTRAASRIGSQRGPEQAVKGNEAKDAERFAWYFSWEPKPADFMNSYLRGMREHWTIDQWRACIDAAIAKSKTAEFGS